LHHFLYFCTDLFIEAFTTRIEAVPITQTVLGSSRKPAPLLPTSQVMISPMMLRSFKSRLVKENRGATSAAIYGYEHGGHLRGNITVVTDNLFLHKVVDADGSIRGDFPIITDLSLVAFFVSRKLGTNDFLAAELTTEERTFLKELSQLQPMAACFMFNWVPSVH